MDTVTPTGSNSDVISPTMGMALKIWWAFMWRFILTGIAIMIPTEIIFAIIMSTLVRGGNAKPETILMVVPIFMLLWVFFAVGSIFLQIYFLKIALSRKYSDFTILLSHK